MFKEKSPAVSMNKATYDEEKQQRQCSSKSTTLSWIVAIILVLLITVLIIQFFFWPFENRITIWSEKDVGAANDQFEIKDHITEQNVASDVNPWDLAFLIDPPNVCATLNSPDSREYARDPEVKLLVLVLSAPEHYEQRQAIRNTWGSVAERRFGPMRLAFVLGTTPNSTLNHIVQGESLVRGDIIQADFPDGHHQLTTKSILTLKWISIRCPHAQYFLKADDDTFVNLGNIAHILSCEPYLSEKKFISGHVQTAVHPQRTTKEEYYVSQSEYSADVYPPFASGSSYMMTGQTAIELFGASQRVKPLLPKEDVFLTGLCAEDIAAPLIHEPSFLIQNPPSPPSWKAFSPLATAHSVSANIMKLVWRDMNQSVHNSLRLMEAAINSTVLLRKRKML